MSVIISLSVVIPLMMSMTSDMDLYVNEGKKNHTCQNTVDRASHRLLRQDADVDDIGDQAPDADGEADITVDVPIAMVKLVDRQRKVFSTLHHVVCHRKTEVTLLACSQQVLFLSVFPFFLNSHKTTHSLSKRKRERVQNTHPLSLSHTHKRIY